ncbi:MAG: universal stress protein [Acidimicrobiales bacterium]
MSVAVFPAKDSAPPIVAVAVDGSRSSASALAWAAEEARLRHATLRVIHAWMVPALGSASVYVPADLFTELPTDAQATLDHQIDEILGRPGDLVIERVVIEGVTSSSILLAAKGAEMLVVGSRGHGGVSGLLLGSVSTSLVHHAQCPVVVVRS